MESSDTTTRITERGTSERVLVGVTVALIVVYIAIDVALRFLRPDYGLVRDVESDYGRGRFSWLMDLNFVIRGLLSVAALVVLARRRVAVRWTGTLLAIWAAASALLAAFPTNVPGLPRLASGPVHVGLAGAAFVCCAIATIGMSVRVVRRRGASWSTAIGLLVVACLGAVFLIALVAAPALHAPGLLERLFLLSELVWLGWASVATTAIPRASGRTSPGEVVAG